MSLRKVSVGLVLLVVIAGTGAYHADRGLRGRPIAVGEAITAPEVIPRQIAKSESAKTEVVKEPVPPTIDAEGFLARLSKLNTCYVQDCDYPRSDSRSYEFALGQDIQDTLFLFADHARSENLERQEIAEVGLQFLASTDGHVQEAALDLLATQPPGPEILDAILEHVVEGYDAELIGQALVELERYTSRADRAKIDETLARTLMTGAPFVAREISLRIAPFLDTVSYEFFQDIASRLPPESSPRLLLESSLADFQRRNSEG